MTISFFFDDVTALAGDKSYLNKIKWILTCHTLHMTLLIRIGQSIRKLWAIGSPLGLLVEYIIRIVFASDISCRAKIGPGLVIVHGHDIVIGADVIIGRDCTIFNGVTLGNRNLIRSSLGNQPHIGDKVTLSTGSKILGRICIGDNSVVGANAVVISDVPENSTVVGVPGRVINKARSQTNNHNHQ
ncbi:serine O-acetyltransferase [Sphaerotilus microaerophilus]|uniref:serine O-acetyltransferase n=1 Tax=Sphaerotilus microaerophilus TaxID=2914710 RepID=UPI002073EE29|nr:hypothetical protein [Sphaerotilus sp. FB-5]